jgi:hypothetical protein
VTVEYITEAPGNPFPLGRSIVNHDPRNRGFAALQQPGLTAQAKPGSVWFTRDVYDQIGSSCTANAAVGVLRTGPFRNLPGVKAAWPQYDSEQERFDLYRVAQRNDPWEGEEPDYEGTSTDAPFRVLRDRGVIPGWRWLFGEAELEEWVTLYGPAAIGVNFYSEMFFPDAQGIMNIGGYLAGGHAMRVVQFHRRLKRYRIVQTYGLPWGNRGRAWITQEGMRRLLAEQGEACTIQV